MATPSAAEKLAEMFDKLTGDVPQSIDDHQAVDLEPIDGMLRRVIVCCDCGLVHLMSIDAATKRAYFVREDGPRGEDIRVRAKQSGVTFGLIDRIDALTTLLAQAKEALAFLAAEGAKISEARFEAERKLLLAESRLADAETKSRIDQEQCDRMTDLAGRLAQELTQVERERDEAQRKAGNFEALFEGHHEAHTLAVDDCPHDEKTWVCCGACHCAALARAESAEQLLSEMAEGLRDCPRCHHAWERHPPCGHANPSGGPCLRHACHGHDGSDGPCDCKHTLAAEARALLAKFDARKGER